MEEIDITEAFDAIACSEERISDEAYKEGFVKGQKEGLIEGYHLGYHRGAEVGAEIGYYKGVISSLIENKGKLPDGVASKIDNQLQKLNESLESFPEDNDSEIDILSLLENIRAQYKRICSLAKINLFYQVSPTMSF